MAQIAKNERDKTLEEYGMRTGNPDDQRNALIAFLSDKGITEKCTVRDAYAFLKQKFVAANHYIELSKTEIRKMEEAPSSMVAIKLHVPSRRWPTLRYSAAFGWRRLANRSSLSRFQYLKRNASRSSSALLTNLRLLLLDLALVRLAGCSCWKSRQCSPSFR